MSDNLQDIMQESQPIGEVSIGDTASSVPTTTAQPSQPTPEKPKRQKPEGPPDALSSINPAFYNTMVNTIHSISEVVDKVKLIIKPSSSPSEIAEKRQQVMQQTVVTHAEIKKASKINSRALGALVIGALVIAIGFVGIKAVQTLQGNGGFLGIGNGNGEPTPTLSEVVPEAPSIYARDEVILVLEEDINTLDGQLSSTVLKESSLDVPQLDMDIRF